MAAKSIAVLVAVVAPVTLVVPLPTTVQAVPVLLLLGWASGHVLAVEPGAFADPLMRALVAIAVSLSATVAVSTALLYLGLWSAVTVLLTLSTATLVGAALTGSVVSLRIGARS